MGGPPNFNLQPPPAPNFGYHLLEGDEKCLTEIDNINRHRDPSGVIPEQVLTDVHQNLVTLVSEGAMPYAVIPITHDYRPTGELDDSGREKGSFYWMGKTAVEVAINGKYSYKHAAELARGDVEIAEAEHSEQSMAPGMTYFFISPKMSPSDAEQSVAKTAGLHKSDSLRSSKLILNKDGTIEKRQLYSLLVDDIPLDAWVALLKDPANLFGKSIEVDNPNSALSVMKTFKELAVPTEQVPEGVISLVAAAAAYIDDPIARKKVEYQLAMYRSSEKQEIMHKEAEHTADEWLQFEIALADSDLKGQTSPEIAAFINGLKAQWGDKDKAVIDAMRIPGTDRFNMSRALAIVVEKAKRNMLWVPAAVITGNKKVLKQLDMATARKIETNHKFMRTLQANNFDARQVQAMQVQNNQFIARQNVRAGGGCPGEESTDFNSGDDTLGGGSINSVEKLLKSIFGEDRDNLGSRTFDCPHCGKENRRPVRNEQIEDCQKCGEKVTC